MFDVLDVIKNIQSLYETNSNLAVLKDFERVLDEMDLYVYRNWEDGEVAYGPQVDRHWITVGLMWSEDKMPDPHGGKRLIDLGCKVKYQKSHLIEPRPIRTPSDMRPNSKKGRLDRSPIWIVEIQMPKKIAFDMYNGYMDKMKNENIKPVEEPVLPNANAPQIPAGNMQNSPMGVPPMGMMPQQPMG
jgi:hypothetical protein